MTLGRLGSLLFAFALLGTTAVTGAVSTRAQVDPGSVSRPGVVKITYQVEVVDRRGNTGLAQVTGSGLLFDSNGYIATNQHVIGDATGLVNVDLLDGRKFQGTVVGQDRMTDVAVVKIEGADLPLVKIGDSSTLAAGQRVLLIGHSPLVLDPTKGDAGVITGLDGVWLSNIGANHRGLIRTSVIGSPGDSGGALLDEEGRIIGMPVLRRNDVASGRFVEGLHIPVNRVMAVSRAIIAYGRVPRAYIGTNTSSIDPAQAAVYGLASDKGVLVQFLDDEGPAFAAGIRRGDIIKAVDGTEVIWKEQFADLVQGHQPGEVVTLSGVRRNGAPFTTGVQTIQRPDDDDAFERLSYE